MYEDKSIWVRKGATLSDKSARQEFGLTQQEIVAAIHVEIGASVGRRGVGVDCFPWGPKQKTGRAHLAWRRTGWRSIFGREGRNRNGA